MDASDAEAILALLDKAGASQERRRHDASLNRRAEMALVVANAVAASQIRQPDETSRALEAAAQLLSDPT